MQHRGIHTRYANASRGGLQVRAASGSGLRLSGYASVTGTPYEVNDWLGSYSETIARGAFSAALASYPDTRLLLNHDGIPLARTTSGTLTLREFTLPNADPLGLGLTGLWVVAELDPNSGLASDVRSALARGDLSQMSFAFTTARDTWNSDYSSRTVNEIGELPDVSLVTYPANGRTIATLG